MDIELNATVAEYKPRLLKLEELAARGASNFPPTFRREMLPKKFREPTFDVVIDFLTRYGKKKIAHQDFSSVNIFFTHTVEVLKIFFRAADVVVETKSKTVYPLQDGTDRRCVKVADSIKTLSFSLTDKAIIKWYVCAANAWEFGFDPTSKKIFPASDQLNILKSIITMIYDFDTTKIDERLLGFPFEYSPSTQNIHGSMEVVSDVVFDIVFELVKENGKKIKNLDDGEGLSKYAEIFMLVSACARMIGKPEKHLFSTECKCWACVTNPEYSKILKTPPRLPKKIYPTHLGKYNYVYVVCCFLQDLVPRIMLAGDKIVSGMEPLFMSAKGVVQIKVDEDLTELIKWTLENCPSHGGIMFRSKNIPDTDYIVNRFTDDLDHITISDQSEFVERFHDKDILIIELSGWSTVKDAVDDYCGSDRMF